MGTMQDRVNKRQRIQPLPLGDDDPNTHLDAATQAECLDWLSFHRIWGRLSDEALQAIAQSLSVLRIDANADIYEQEQKPVGLYLLKWGTVEIYRRSPVGETHILYRNAGDIFGYAPLVQRRDDTVYQASAKTLSACEIWFLKRAKARHLIQTYPDIQGSINELLALDIAHFAKRMAQEQLRIQGLQPYIRSVPTQETVIGKSKVAEKLRQSINAVSGDIKPVILQAPGGSGKSFVAGMIHRQSALGDRPFAEIDCAQLPRDEAEVIQTTALFGQEGGSLGVLELLERGTLLIDNVQLLPGTERDRLIHYLNTHTFTRNPTHPSPHLPIHSPTPPLLESWIRLILATPRPFSLLTIPHHTLKLFSLSQRKDDIPDFAQYFLDRFCREQNHVPLRLDQADLRRLLSYPYPGNVSELAGILKRAVIMTPPGQTVIPEQVLWSVQSDKNAFRIDLLNQFPWLRRFLLSDWWPERIWIGMMALFIPVTIMGFIGPQSREASMTLNFFWAWWWPMYLFLFVFVGRLWCAVCPFMITAEWLRKLSLWVWPRSLLPWPTQWMNRWGAWILFGGFVAIYLWEKLWDLPHTPYLSSWLLVVITAGAIIGSLVYERRIWCRHLCPIGGMNGMFAKLSVIELRSTQQVCGSQCSTFGCFKGSDATPVTFADALPNEGQATEGCPLYSHPAQLQDNRDCMLCMTCLKACPNRSGQLNLRFPATDLLENHRGFWAEAALMLLLLGGVVMHHSQRIFDWLGISTVPLDADHLLIALPVVLGLLSIPALLFFMVHAIARTLDPDQPSYLAVVYAYLPITLTTNLAHYIPSAITEAGQILPVIARTFGLSSNGLPTLTWSLDVAQFLQGITLLSGLAFSIYPLMRITRRPLLSNLPHLFLITIITGFCFYLMGILDFRF